MEFSTKKSMQAIIKVLSSAFPIGILTKISLFRQDDDDIVIAEKPLIFQVRKKQMTAEFFENF